MGAVVTPIDPRRVDRCQKGRLMNQQNVMARLTVLFRDVFDDPELVISPATTAADVAAWDSMSHVTLIVAVEQAFGIRFRTAEMDSLHNVGALAQLIGDKCAALVSRD